MTAHDVDLSSFQHSREDVKRKRYLLHLRDNKVTWCFYAHVQREYVKIFAKSLFIRVVKWSGTETKTFNLRKSIKWLKLLSVQK